MTTIQIKAKLTIVNAPNPDSTNRIAQHKCSLDEQTIHCHAMEQLIAVVQELSLARNLQSIMAIVKQAARFLTGADGATFILRDGDRCFYADEDAIAPLWKGQRFPMKICMGGWVMLNRQPAIIFDIYGDARIPFEAYSPTFVKSLAMVPIRTIDPIGAIGVYWATPHQPTDTEVKILQALADTTAVAIENVQVYAELEQRVRDRTAELEATNQRLIEEIREREEAEEKVRRLSITDELTSLHNRRGFFLLAQQQWKLARRVNTPCLLLFIDLDGLKKINDTFGHEMGDKAIADAAWLLKQTFRDSDIVARLGGDEFVVFLSNCSDSADIIQERLQGNIDFFNQNHQRCYQLSMSIGVEICCPKSDISLEKLVAKADESMYDRKRSKRNHLMAS